MAGNLNRIKFLGLTNYFNNDSLLYQQSVDTPYYAIYNIRWDGSGSALTNTVFFQFSRGLWSVGSAIPPPFDSGVYVGQYILTKLNYSVNVPISIQSNNGFGNYRSMLNLNPDKFCFKGYYNFFNVFRSSKLVIEDSDEQPSSQYYTFEITPLAANLIGYCTPNVQYINRKIKN